MVEARYLRAYRARNVPMQRLRPFIAGMRQEGQQNLKRLAGQTDAYAALEQLPRWNIYFKGSEGQPSRRLRLGRHKVSPTGSPQSTTGPWRVMRWADKYRTFNHLPDEAILSHK